MTGVAGQTEELNVAMVPQCGPATVSGTVYDAANQQPIDQALVEVNTSGGSDRTDQDGRWTLQVPVANNLPFTAEFTASAPDFNPKTEAIELFCGAHITLNFGQDSTK